MSLHVFASIVTPFGTAANNRGETEGNITTLQKLIWMGLPHTTISAESIRFALRRLLAEQENGRINRSYNETSRVNEWRDREFASWGKPADETYIDDDLLGFMSADAAKAEAEDTTESAEVIPGKGDKQKPDAVQGQLTFGSAEVVPGKGDKQEKTKRKPKGTATVRRGVLEVTRAVSLTPWPGDVTFNAASPGATPSAAKQGVNPVPYGTEVHATRYQYGLALTPDRLKNKTRAAKALYALCQLGTVAGNHARFLFDFAPDGIVFRITEDPAPRLLYCFETTDEGRTIEAPILTQRVANRDIQAKELVIGGSFARSQTAKELKELGATIPSPGGVLAAVEEVVKRIEAALAKGAAS
jgi:CRISPR-associated protein Cst2